MGNGKHYNFGTQSTPVSCFILDIMEKNESCPFLALQIR